jgi:hypothetical protein
MSTSIGKTGKDLPATHVLVSLALISVTLVVNKIFYQLDSMSKNNLVTMQS